MAGTVIKLFKCGGCGAVLDEADTETQLPCGCGGRVMLRPAAPDYKTVLRYFNTHPAKLLVFLKENIFHVC